MDGRVQRGWTPLLQQLGGMGERCKLPNRGAPISQEINELLCFILTNVLHTCTCMYRLRTVLYQCASCIERYNPCT